MVISYSWLKSYIPELELNPQEIAAVLTDIGLEVETIETFESVKGGLNGLVIGYVLEKEKHPDADRLNVTKVQVDHQGTIHQIVCGAANVEKGQKVVVALPGTTLFPTDGEPFKIKLSKIRGVESAGMICAEDEIGLGKSHDGIMILDPQAKIGAPVADYFNVSTDYVIHIGLTPNRIDAASHLGVARDLVAALKHRFGFKGKPLLPETLNLKPTSNESLKISIEDANACKKYLGLRIKNIKVTDSPEWLKQRLASIGLRSINNVVDITNFVMHECGQPLHAFDAAKIKGNHIRVRMAVEGEKIITLDGVERKLTINDQVIANENEPMCLAGIFGGIDSGVSDQTTEIVLESAWFDPVVVRKSARRNELHTDSSFRFERGADPEMTKWALERAAFLISSIAGGVPDNEYVYVEKSDFKRPVIELNLESLNAFAGHQFQKEEVESILKSLDFGIESTQGNVFNLLSPLYRVDVTRAVDVYEEILRIYGYNNIPIPGKVNATPQLQNGLDHEKLVETISSFLADKGFSEIMNNSLNAEVVNELNAGVKSVKLLNPLSSELNVLRNTLLFGGLHSIAWNSNRQNANLKFFEIGTIYSSTDEKTKEDLQVGIWLTGEKGEGSWKDAKGEHDYYSIKGITDSLLARFVQTSLSVAFNEPSNLMLDTYVISLNGKTLAEAGTVKPEVLKQFDIKHSVYFVSFSISVLKEAIKRTRFTFKEVSKFPSIHRDLALLVDEKIEFGTLKEIVLQTDKRLITAVNIFDVYIGKNLEPGKRSYAISLTIVDDQKTLKDEEVEKLMEKVLKNITDKTGAVLR